MFNHRASLTAAAIAAALLQVSVAHAETKLYVGNVAPYAYLEGAPQRGLVYELLHETALRVDHSGTVHVVPLRRQIEMLLHERDSLGSVTRLPERETQFSWAVKLMQEPIALVTLSRSAVDISSTEGARQLRVGVLLGGPAEAVARRAGYTQIQTTTDNRNNVNKLVAGRIDAIVVLGGLFATAEAMPVTDGPVLREGAVLERVDVYLAGPPGMPPAELKKWNEAFQALRRDGGYARIMQRYHHPE